MNHNLFIEIIKNHSRFSDDEDFMFREVDRNIYFEKRTANIGFRLSFAYTPYGDNFHVHALGAYERFNEVEEVLQQLLDSDIQSYYTIHVSPDESDIPPNLPHIKTENNFHFEIKEPEEYVFS